MGHLRLKGRLPRTRNWQRVVGTLEDATAGVEAVAGRTAGAARVELRRAADRPYVWYPYWLLIQLATSTSTPERFADSLRDHGVDLSSDASALTFLSAIKRAVEDQRAKFGAPTALDELALNAFHRAVGRTILSDANSLFDSGLDDVRRAFSRFAPKKAFGIISRAYLGAFYGEILRYFLSFELGNHIRKDGRFPSLDSAEEFNRDLDSYVHQVSELVDEFAQGWYSKHLWEHGSISEEAVSRFLHIAFRKLQQQLENEA